jgi:alpha-pyrone synthase
MEKGNPQIISIGTAVPGFKITGKQHLEFVRERSQLTVEKERIFAKIYSSCEISERYSVLDDFTPESGSKSIFPEIASGKVLPQIGDRMLLYEKHAPDLCYNAVENCLSKTKPEIKNKISHIITFSCTGMYAPGLDIDLIKKFDLSQDVERYCINFMGCYAAIVAIRNAFHFVKSNPEATVLLVGVELCTLHYSHTHDNEQAVANAIFGDGAAAVIISNSSDFEGVLKIKKFKTQTIASGVNEMTWNIRDDIFKLKLSSYVPLMIKQGISNLVEGLLTDSKQELSNKIYAVHPGGAAILKACEKALSLTRSDLQNSYHVLNKYGNMSSVTILFVLNEILNNKSFSESGREVIGCAFGPGLTMESMLLEVM